MGGARVAGRATVIALLAGMLIARDAHAQADANPLEASHAARVRGESGKPVTLAVRLRNLTGEALAMQPRIILPADWLPLLGTSPIALAPHESDSWLISVRIPARARAGSYHVPFSVVDPAGLLLLRDSVEVVIGEKHGVAVTLTDHPAYAISEERYRLGVLVQNQQSGVGTLGGAAVGATAGSFLGRNNVRANIIGAVGGAIVGGIVGSVVENGVSTGNAVEFIIREDDGQTISVVQTNEEQFSPGERVVLTRGARTRIARASPGT